MRRLILVTAAVSTMLVGGVVPAATADTGYDISYQTIPGYGGDPLKAFVLTPTGRGNGPFPLLVMPSSWGTPNLEYVGAAGRLATEHGYEVISYSSRGFYDSGGQNDIAGPATVGDVSAVIDWAGNHHADLNRVGVVGISYGAGVGLLAAADDPRIKAVSAMSAWTDLIGSLDPNDTVAVQAAAALLLIGDVTSKPSPEMVKAQIDFLAGDIDAIKPLGPARSAATKVDRINANHPAVMIANQWDDSLFPPSQITDFFQRLTTPKRLLLQPGDHGTAEIPGLTGITNESWDTTARWMDHYLLGAANGVDGEQPVRLQDKTTRDWRSYPDWQSVGTGHNLYLSKPDLTGFGKLGGQSTGWKRTELTGVPTIADSGPILLTGLFQGYFGVPPLVNTVLVDKNAAGVWSSSAYGQAATLAGAARLHATVTPSKADTTLVAYLYDVDALGNGGLITHKPITLHASGSQSLDLRLEPTVWTVPKGHHLTLVVDSMDLRYTSTSKLGGTVTFGSPAGDPSVLTVPTAAG
ncbi:alpha/beta fold hydrolase [Labedaea rhizosphaerae]|uniref:Putative acyl esterase n=1 Tax=Labedaea rhizosphaerae TaxID=598644 RepID=A0A4R6SN66_LABRH|nr:alpha/beta fold hydrolase [Labedaea rhizosphaerae]TDQ05467.1 putative acyl esterase [Labedaea rhizosphaerae]